MAAAPLFPLGSSELDLEASAPLPAIEIGRWRSARPCDYLTRKVPLVVSV